ncbi:uncharacterized protein PV09_03734 [Verruconis gallopava]|uniref:Uncharacterized protein n=1 Tax=Verruconis gallopava TaxID=253628 RepID=A0A0D1XR63_9PEZI|nr:uncharacterized protein PV09_03734 [Verruconis gallopava]KIW05186.1 hypothetical protein PV09_03734 [Verruconis gallopava]
MLFKCLIFAVFAFLAAAAPGGDKDYNDKDWGKNQCYIKHVTYYTTDYNYATKVDYAYTTKVKSWEVPYVTKVPVTTWVETKLTQTKYKTDVDKYPVTKIDKYPVVKSEVKDQKICKTKWWGDHWDYDNKW